MDRDVTRNRTRWSAGNILIVLLGLLLASSAIVKFAHVQGVVNKMAASGFSGGKLTLVATLELLSAVLFLFSRTRSSGLLMLSAFLGGAICSHVQLGEYAKAGGPSFLLLLVWIASWLRHPQVLWSLDVPHPGTNQLTENRDQGWASGTA
jgi:DoxX-like protein